MSLNIQGLAKKAKRDWVKELCNKNKVNFLALQETKTERWTGFVLEIVGAIWRLNMPMVKL